MFDAAGYLTIEGLHLSGAVLTASNSTRSTALETKFKKVNHMWNDREPQSILTQEIGLCQFCRWYFTGFVHIVENVSRPGYNGSLRRGYGY